MTAYAFRADPRGFLVPASAKAQEAFAKKSGKNVMVSLSDARNPRHHALYWALIAFVREHAVNPVTGETLFPPSVDDDMIHTELKRAVGLVEVREDVITKKQYNVIKSISFENMGQARFARFFDAAVAKIVTDWMPVGTKCDDVRREVEAMVDQMPGRRSS